MSEKNEIPDWAAKELDATKKELTIKTYLCGYRLPEGANIIGNDGKVITCEVFQDTPIWDKRTKQQIQLVSKYIDWDTLYNDPSAYMTHGGIFEDGDYIKAAKFLEALIASRIEALSTKN